MFFLLPAIASVVSTGAGLAGAAATTAAARVPAPLEVAAAAAVVAAAPARPAPAEATEAKAGNKKNVFNHPFFNTNYPNNGPNKYNLHNN